MQIRPEPSSPARCVGTASRVVRCVTIVALVSSGLVVLPAQVHGQITGPATGVPLPGPVDPVDGEDREGRRGDRVHPASELLAADASLFYGFATVDGREVSEAGNVRATDLKQFPAAVTRETLAYRFPAANMIEGALFGTVATRIVRPLDLKGRRFDAEVRGLDYPYADRAHQGLGKRFTISYLDQFNTGVGRIGVSLGVLARKVPQPREYYEGGTNFIPCNTTDAGTAAGGAAVGGDCSLDPKSGAPVYFTGQSGTFRQERVTEALNGYFGALQWQPNERIDVLLDGEHSRRLTVRYRNELGLTDTANGVVPLEIGDNGRLIRWAGQTGVDINAFERRRDEYYTGAGLNVTLRASERLSLAADLGWSSTHRIQDDTSATLEGNNRIGPGGMVAYVADQRTGGFPAITFARPVNLDDYDAFTLAPTARRGHEPRVDEIGAARLDATLATGGFVESVKAGIRYAEHRRRGTLYTYLASASGIPAANVAAGRAGCRIPTIIDDFASQTLDTIRSWAMYDPVCLFDAYAGTSADQATLGGLTGGGITVRERVFGGYVMATFGGKAGNTPIAGNVGLRAVATETTTRVFRFTADPADLVGVSDRVAPVIDLLPSATLEATPSKRLTLKAGLARVLLRSNIEGLGLRRILQAPAGGTDVGRPRPLRSWNADLTTKWRVDRETVLSLGLAYKLLNGSAWPGDVLIPGGPELPSWLTDTEGRGSFIRSVEVGASRRFRSLPKPLDGIRLNGSYVFTDSNFRFADPTAFDKTSPLYLFTPPAGVPAISRHVVSLGARYEAGPFELGATYQYRSLFFRPTGLTPNRFLAGNTHVDVSAGLDIGHHAELTFLAANLTNESESYVRPVADSVGQTAYSGRLFSLGIRLGY